MFQGKMNLILVLCLLVSIGGVVQAARYPFQEQEGYIIALTDIHNGIADKASQDLAKAFYELEVPPHYIFVGGDLTEMGSRHEYSLLKKNYAPIWGKIPIGWMMGNHDSRWADNGFYLFEKELGPPNFAIDFDRFVFIGLNSSTLLEQHGHFGEAQVQWLRKKLMEIGPTKPIVVQAHHPFGGPSQYTDDGYKILDALKDYNVPLILIGHGHSYKVFGSYNHTWIQMLGAGMNRHYTPISWDDQNFYLWEANVETEPKLLVTVPLYNRGSETIEWISEPDYWNGTIEMFVRTNGLRQITAFFKDQTKTFNLSHDGVHNLKWELPIFVEGKELLRLEGVGKDTTLLLHSEIQGDMSNVLWVFPSGDSIFTQPVIDDQYIYFGNQAGTFYALDKQTGNKIWSYQTQAAILSSPALFDDMVVFASTDTFVYALNRSNGSLVWKQALPGIIYTAVVAGESVLATGAGDYHIYGLSPQTGEILWKTLGWGMMQGAGTYYNGEFIFTSWGGVIQRMAEDNGKVIRAYASGSGYETPGPTTPVVFGDRLLYTNTGSKYYGQSLSDRREVWTETGLQVGYASVVVDENFGYLSTLKGEVFQFDPLTGERTWMTQIPQSVYDSSPQIFGDYLALGTTQGDVWILNRHDGRIVKQVSLSKGFIFGKIRATADTLYVGSMDGTIYAIDVSQL